MKHSYKTCLGLFGLIVLCLIISSMQNSAEGFTPLNFKSQAITTPGDFPLTVDKPLVYDSYKYKGVNQVSNNEEQNVWRWYPVFPLPSFEQITNNLRYRNSPDDGTASRAEFSGALYNERRTKTNIIKPLPPAQEGPGARVGYFRAEPNDLFYSIPTNENILY